MKGGFGLVYAAHRLDEVTHLKREKLREFLSLIVWNTLLDELFSKLTFGAFIAHAIVQCPARCPNHQTQYSG